MMAQGKARAIHAVSIGGAVVLVLLGLSLSAGARNDGTRILILIILAALIGLEAWVWQQDRKYIQAQTWEPQDSSFVPRITIRCKQCGEVFPVEDSGARPLVAACPHCGKSGTIRTRSV